MIPNNNLMPLPWYTSIEQQDRNKRFTNQGEIYSLITPPKNLLPFQIKRNVATTATLTVLLRGLNGDLCYDISADMIASGLKVLNKNGEQFIINYNEKQLTTDIIPGFYYAELSDGTNTWYSEVFRVVSDLSNFIKIEYWGVQDLKDIRGDIAIEYESGYHNVMYIDAVLAKPEYELDEEAEEHDTVPVVQKQTSKKIYRFTSVMPECIVDAMQAVYLADYVYVTSEDIQYRSTHFMFTPDWTEDGHYAGVDSEFQTVNVFKNIANAVVQANVVIPISINIKRDTGSLTIFPPVRGAGVEIYVGRKLISQIVTGTAGTGSYSWRIGREEYNSLRNTPQRIGVQMPTSAGAGFYTWDSSLIWSGARTLQVVFKTVSTSSSSIQCILNMNNISSNRSIFAYVQSNVLYVYIGGTLIAQYNVTANTLYNLIVTTDGVRVADVQLNGQQQRGYYSNWVEPNGIYLGMSNPSGNQTFRGTLITMRVFNRALSREEMTLMNNVGRPDLFILSTDLYGACVAEFTPETLPDSLQDNWLSTINDKTLVSYSGNLMNYATDFPVFSYFIRAANYWMRYITNIMPAWESAISGISLETTIIDKQTVQLTDMIVAPSDISVSQPLNNVSPYAISRTGTIPSWITFPEPGSISTAGNNERTPRNANILYSTAYINSYLFVFQEAGPFMFTTIEPASLGWNKNGIPKQLNSYFAIVSNANWAIAGYSGSAQDMIISVSPTSGNANLGMSINVSVRANPNAGARNGAIVIKSTEPQDADSDARVYLWLYQD